MDYFVSLVLMNNNLQKKLTDAALDTLKLVQFDERRLLDRIEYAIRDLHFCNGKSFVKTFKCYWRSAFPLQNNQHKRND